METSVCAIIPRPVFNLTVPLYPAAATVPGTSAQFSLLFHASLDGVGFDFETSESSVYVLPDALLLLEEKSPLGAGVKRPGISLSRHLPITGARVGMQHTIKAIFASISDQRRARVTSAMRSGLVSSWYDVMRYMYILAMLAPIVLY